MQSNQTFIRYSSYVVAASALLMSVAALGDTLTDPTRPPLAVAVSTVTAPASAATPLKLEGIVRQGERLVAIVNGKVVRTGSWVGDARVDAISIDAVHYTRAGQSRIARFETPPIRVRRTAATSEDRS